MSDDPSTPPDAQPIVSAAPLDAQPGERASTADASQWPITLRYGVGIVLIAICALILLLILPLLQIILLSFLIAFIMFLPSRALSRRLHLPYGLSVVISFVIAAVIVVALAVVILPELFRMLGSIRDAVQQVSVQIITQLQASPATIEVAGIPIDMAALSAVLQPILSVDSVNVAANLVHLLFGFFGNAATLVAAIGTASVVALFFLIDLPISGGTMTNWVPPGHSREIVLLFGKIDQLWLKFFRALIIIGTVTGAASFALFLLFGLHGALLMAAFTALIGLIPVVGRIFSIVLVFVMALINGSTTFTSMDNLVFALLTIVAYLVVTQIIGTIVSPKLKGSAINVPTVAIVVGVLVGLSTAGIVGALLVAPIIASLRVFMQYAIAKILLHDPYPHEELPPLQHEGFFSHMLYVKKKEEPSGAEV
jgi:predicted PurR-regulated permease PerM